MVGEIVDGKVFAGKVPCCFFRLKMPKSSFSLKAFGDTTVEKIKSLKGKAVSVEGYIKNAKKEDGTFVLELICTYVAELFPAEYQTESDIQKEIDDIPF